MHVWINLLDNAIKFSPNQGIITMFLKQENDQVKFIWKMKALELTRK